MRYLLSLLASILLMQIFVAVLPSSAAEIAPPPIDREAAEAAFLEGYDYYLKNRLWNSLAKLNEAHSKDTYFIDTYYMRSLVYRRMGRYPEAISMMRSYLEVRRDDPRGRMILDTIIGEWDIIQSEIVPSNISYQLFFDSHTLNTFLRIPLHQQPTLSGLKGLGKISSVGDLLFVPDTLGNKIWAFSMNDNRQNIVVELEEPVKVIPYAPSFAYAIQKSGDVSVLTGNRQYNTVEVEYKGSTEANVADAVLVDSTLMAVADRTGQAVRFFGVPSLGETAEWRPQDSDTSQKLFEPNALSMFGPFLAVSDRGNQRVYVIDVYSQSLKDTLEVPFPRDLVWGGNGALYVLSENGGLYRKYPVGSESEEVELLVEGMANAWTLDWTNRGLVISDIVSRTWWHSPVYPSREKTFGAVTLSSPWLERHGDSEILMINAGVASIYNDYVRRRIPETQVVWRNEVRPSRAMRSEAANGSYTFFYTPSGGEGENLIDGEVVNVSTVNEVMAHIGRASQAGREIPRVIVLDTRIDASESELSVLLAFLLQQDIRLDLWAIGRPANANLARISQITLGNTYFSRTLETVLPNQRLHWVISVPLPPDTVTFGYPSESTLSLFASIGGMVFNDWLPIWPALLDTK